MDGDKIDYPHTAAHHERGDWNPLWEQVRTLDPAFLEAYLAFRSASIEGDALPRKFKELILVAINAATTHLYEPGVRRHMRNAMDAGASTQEILETVQMVSIMGIHSCNLAIPILLEEADRTGTQE